MVCAACFEELLPAATDGTEEASAVAEGDMCMWCADTNGDDNKLLCDDCPKVHPHHPPPFLDTRMRQVWGFLARSCVACATPHSRGL
jgi:hypothetical protein